MKQQIERDGRSDHFSEIAGGDGDLRASPEGKRHGAAEMVAAGLGQVASRNDAQLDGQGLQQDGHKIRQHDDR